MTYDFGECLDGWSVEPGTNVLVAGPPHSGKRQLVRDLTRSGVADGEGTIVISVRDTANRIRGLIEREDASDPERPDPDEFVGIVDCVSERVGDAAAETDMVSYARSPTDLTGIGIKFAEFIEHFHCERGIDRNRVVLDSVTTLLQYSTLQTVFRFLHAVTTRVTEVDGVGVFVVESTVHDEETMGTVRELFDGVVTTSRDADVGVDLPDSVRTGTGV